LFFGAGKLLFSFCEGEGDSTRESARGQFSIFGAIEEKEVCGFLVGMRVKKNLNERGEGAWSEQFWSGAAGAGIFFKSGDLVVHRACTGNAESHPARTASQEHLTQRTPRAPRKNPRLEFLTYALKD
jgi:hypothetical protein